MIAVLIWLKLAGEAALGDQRPVFERQWKGAAAVLLAVAGAILLWKRYGRRDAEPSEPVLARPAPADSAVLITAHSVPMPAFGDDISEGTVTRWLKQRGDRVQAGEPLVTVSVGKADIEIPAGASGDLREISIPAGTTAPVGTVLAVIEPFAAGSSDQPG
ncbi:lipoyl domain-containing protein [Actinoplanes sp. M2I2]|uniref:lipoyl domain-containing protein n=1 Tax=Actinoplanes sp. M2I2 TaxID=1734444 RepID=UPI0020200F71|nr:lipoyl domain-containing protein [Actinoplanes sp. M2I2]